MTSGSAAAAAGSVEVTSRPTTLSPSPRANSTSVTFPQSETMRVLLVTTTSRPSADRTVTGSSPVGVALGTTSPAADVPQAEMRNSSNVAIPAIARLRMTNTTTAPIAPMATAGATSQTQSGVPDELAPGCVPVAWSCGPAVTSELIPFENVTGTTRSCDLSPGARSSDRVVTPQATSRQSVSPSMTGFSTSSTSKLPPGP